jgi:hypothetical protein
VRDFQRSHRAQRINASVKPPEAVRKTPDVRRPVTHVRDFQRSHKPQGIDAALKAHETPPKTLLEQESDLGGFQANDPTTVGGQPGTPGLDAAQDANDVFRAGGEPVDRAPDAAQTTDDVARVGAPAADRAPDELQAALPYIAQRDPPQTVGMASVSRADAAQNTPPSILESKATPTTRSLGALWVAMAMVMAVVAFGLVDFLFRRTYAKRVLAFGARRLQPPPDYPRLVNLSWPPPNQFEADTGVASSLESVKKALGTIEEAVGEISSRQLRRLS